MSDDLERHRDRRAGHRAARRTARPTAANRANAMRLFVALYPPPERVQELLQTLRNESLPLHRETPPDQVHVTALFIGEVDPPRLDTVLESVERAAAGIAPFELRPLHLAPLPESGPARLVAAITDAPSGLLELNNRLVQRLAASKKRVQRFLPHLTLCRFATPTAVDIATPLVSLAPFAIDAVHLMQSHLGADGVAHRGLARVQLGG